MLGTDRDGATGFLLECITFTELCMDRAIKSRDWKAESAYLRALMAQQLSSRLLKPDISRHSPAEVYVQRVTAQGSEAVRRHMELVQRGTETHGELSAAHWLLAYFPWATAQKPRTMHPDIAAAAQAALDLGYEPAGTSECFLLLRKAEQEEDDIQLFRQAVLLAEAITDWEMDDGYLRATADKAAGRIRDDASLQTLDDEMLAKAARLWPESRRVRKLIERRDAYQRRQPVSGGDSMN